MQSDAVHRAADSWIRAELPGSGGQALFVTVGVHGEAAVAAAPVVAVRGKAVRENMAVRTKPVKKLQVFVRSALLHRNQTHCPSEACTTLMEQILYIWTQAKAHS